MYATEWMCKFVCEFAMCEFVLKVWLFQHTMLDTKMQLCPRGYEDPLLVSV